MPIADISQWQGNVNWDALAASNPEAVIIRAGWGVGGRDTQFQSNWSQAKARGIKRIAYWFCYPAYNSPQAEANDFNAVVGPLGPGEGMAGDFENDPGALAWPSNGLGWAQQFLTTTGGPNYIPGFYGSPSFLESHNLVSLADTWWLWIADWYVDSPNTMGKQGSLWQYTDCGSIPGISGCVDCNYPMVPVGNLVVPGAGDPPPALPAKTWNPPLPDWMQPYVAGSDQVVHLGNYCTAKVFQNSGTWYKNNTPIGTPQVGQFAQWKLANRVGGVWYDMDESGGPTGNPSGFLSPDQAYWITDSSIDTTGCGGTDPVAVAKAQGATVYTLG